MGISRFHFDSGANLLKDFSRVLIHQCKYKWFSASDLCRAEGHPIKVIDTVKRFFKCNNCTNRTVSLEVVPLISCKQCGSSKWSRAGMIKVPTSLLFTWLKFSYIMLGYIRLLEF